MTIETGTSERLATAYEGISANRDGTLSGASSVLLAHAICEEVASLRESVDAAAALLSTAGIGDVGIAIVDGSGNISKQFGIDDVPAFAPVFIQVTFDSHALGADLQIILDTAVGGNSYILFTVKDAGLADVFLRIPQDERKAWTMAEGDLMRVLWTDPASTNWSVRVGLVAASATSVPPTVGIT